MNSITSSILLIFFMLLSPIMLSLTNHIKSISFPNYVTLSIKYAFLLSLVPLTMSFHPMLNY